MWKKMIVVLLSFSMIGMSGCAITNMESVLTSEGKGTMPATEEKIENTPSHEEPDSIDFSSYVDFIVEVPTYRDPVILQLTDPQIIDASQERTPDRLGTTHDEFWAADKVEERCYQYIRETIQVTNPDFIIITGDLVYGEFDDNGTALQGFIQFMETFEIPWSPVFGNHDNESQKGVDWQCEQLENANYCLFKQGTLLKGNGNYSVGIVQGNQLKRVFYLLDSNGCTNASDTTLESRQFSATVGFRNSQITWYTESIQAIKSVSSNTKISFAYHIQQTVFQDAYAKYGFDNETTKENPINIDSLDHRTEGDFGYLGAPLKKPWDADYSIWEGMKALGVDSIFVGHEHCNSASVVYEGVRFQFGQKCSTYDRTNYQKPDGTILGSYYEKDGTPLVGGSVIVLSQEDGSIQNAYIYLCENV